MAETLYIITTGGDILTVSEVTALAIDNTFTIFPGDYYRNEWVDQTVTVSDTLLTSQYGDQVTPSALRPESWICSFWKFTRGASLPIMYHKWSDTFAICNLPPNAEDATASFYLPLVNGGIAVYSGVTASTTAITINNDLTIYPGDYYRNTYVDQTEEGSSDIVATHQKGDARDGDALNSESWTASHYQIARAGLLSLHTPWAHVRGGPTTAFPQAA